MTATARDQPSSLTAPPSWAKRRVARLLVLGSVAAALLGGAGASPAGAAVASATSSNWAGYAVSRSGTRFRRVSASWVVPAATCSAGTPTYSAVWIGLGGFESSSDGLEQTGVDADCTSAGRASYTIWYELLPAGAVTVHTSVRAGDHITASVTVSGSKVRLRVRDLTSGGGFTKVRRISAADVDLSSADWIVEAPAACRTRNDCRTLALSNFGTVTFSRASATTTGGRTGTISSSAWSATKITLGQTTENASFPASSNSGGATPPAYRRAARPSP